MTKNSDGFINGKVPVYLIDKNFQPTGEKILVAKDNLTVVGYVD